MVSKKIVFIGAGNLATQLSIAMQSADYQVVQVYSRDIQNARQLAVRLQATHTNRLEKLDKTADIYLFAVPDDVLPDILNQLPFSEKLYIHTAGSVPQSIFQMHSSNYGVLYPLQTFSKHKQVDFKQIPICIEANSDSNKLIISDIAKQLSPIVYEISSEERAYLHVAAVFANNFSNHMFALAEEILKRHNLPFEILKPLIAESFQKAFHSTPLQAQTGPAIRNDQKIIQKHLKMLENTPDLKKIYTFVTQSIFETHQTC